MCCVQLQTSFQAQAQYWIVVPRALCDSCSKNRNLNPVIYRPLICVPCGWSALTTSRRQRLGQKIIDRPLSSDFVKPESATPGKGIAF